jgi:thiaminase
MTGQEFQGSALVLSAGGLWREATEAQFLSAIHEGNLPPEAFSRWLVQD